ncbi:asparagine synthase (glutamine-hydrolyzing) [Ideonella sp. BN130291]|uniref:asparagine synthase (glutamine-hydrolyzing) n=1 Tax=Ideonella sp. BN130291 TaxID=3112940 RepID=UPI002E26740F|nr:asparagine synthase (glutamine-hydrolyzing) [Ideonella sp. BN130291]
MCGIAGIHRGTWGRAPRRDESLAMIGALHHRGPDGTGIEAGDTVGLAHARLSIIDIAGGAQPIANEDGRIRVVFNGEIFNYLELRAELQRLGHVFRTQSDTEVLVHLYEEHGEDFLQQLNGQFAIALWDDHRQRLLLARDRTGIRPLYFTQADGRLLFASEVKALFMLPEVKRRLDPVGLAQVFSYWAPLGDNTVFEGIRQLPPGHRMVVEGDRLHTDCYWDWTFPDGTPPPRDEREAAEELRALLLDAVRLQLRADVPVGAYLSGGLDSSIVSSLIRHQTDTPLDTFSLTFEDAEFDESEHQQAMVRHLGTRHTTVRVSRAHIGAAFGRTVWHAETALVRTAPTPLMLLASAVRAAGLKVVLTGEGADEVFGGYDLFKEAKIRRFLARAPQSTWRGRILERLYPYLTHSPMAARGVTQRFFSEGLEHQHQPWFAHATRIASTRRVLQFMRPELAERVAAADPYQALAATLPAGISRWSPMARDQYVEAHTLMSGYLLGAQGDRVAMAHSVEGRVPFLDHRVIEFANRLPPQLKLRGLAEKYLLKQATRADLPPSITQRTKQPYRAPDSASFFQDGRPTEEVAELLSPQSIEAAGLFDADAVGRLSAKCARGRAIGFPDNMAFVGVLSTMHLHRQFVQPAVFGAT